jgi:hypothetical protein
MQQAIDRVVLHGKCPWHPFYAQSSSDQEKEMFQRVLEIVNRMQSALSIRASDYPKHHIQGDQTTQIYEITLFNSHHPDHKIESWWWVDVSDWKDWWVSPVEQWMLSQYGWEFRTKHLSNL